MKWAVRAAAVVAAVLLGILLWRSRASRAGSELTTDAGAARTLDAGVGLAARAVTPALAVEKSAQALQQGTVCGTVQSTVDAAAVPRATLTFVGPKGAVDTVSAQDGAFCFVAPAAGAYVLEQAHAAGFVPYRSGGVRDGIRVFAYPGVTLRGLVVMLDPGQLARVRVVDERGVGLRNASLLGERSTALEGQVLATTDEKGSARLAVNGELRVVAAHPDHFSSQVVLVARGEGGPEQEVTLRARTERGTGRIRGRVVDAKGEPVPGARVSLRGNAHTWPTKVDDASRLQSRTEFAAGAPQTNANERGEFVFEGLYGRGYTCVAMADGHAGVKVDTLVNAAPLRIVLGEEHLLRGVVLDATSQLPVPAFVVWYVGEHGRWRQATFIRHDGTFELHGLLHGETQLFVAAQDYMRSERMTVNLEGGGDTELKISLTPGVVVSGRVTNESTGAPVAGARVYAPKDPGEPAGMAAMQVRTRTDGTFSITSLGHETKAITVQASGFAATVLPLSHQVLERGTSLDVKLTPVQAPRPRASGAAAPVTAEPASDLAADPTP